MTRLLLRLLGVIVVCICGAVAVSISHGKPSPAGTEDRTETVIVSVVDGDTVRVDGDPFNQTDRVRILGINAPEIPHPGKSGQCYGPAATTRLRTLLPPGTRVVLISDPSQAGQDIYGRLLRYVEVKGVDVGLGQIAAGAASARKDRVPVARYGHYLTAELKARGSVLGLWRACR